MGITDEIAKFVVEVGYDQMPEEALGTAKRAILDCLGCTLAGTLEPASKIMTAYVKELGGTPEAAVIGGGFKTSAPQAALANGTLGHALDYDDVATSWIGHPSVALVPALMALGEKEKLSGKAILAGYIVGFEVGARLGGSIGFGHYIWGWHATVTLGSVAAAAASARVMGLDAGQVRMALGIAASLAGGTRQNFGSMTKPLHAGNAARNGIVAALLAKKGFTADQEILESPMGFLKLFSGGADYDPAKMTEGLGDAYNIVTSGVSMKPYPCCRLTHRCIDGILHLVQKHHPMPEDVARVECHTPETSPQVLIHARPGSGLEGKFSMQYCMAVALLDGAVGLQQFADDRVRDPSIQELLSRVAFVHPEGLDGQDILTNPERVTIVFTDGTELSHDALVARGDPQNPMTQDELAQKYKNCASTVLSRDKAEESLEWITRLERLEDISALMDLFSSSASV